MNATSPDDRRQGAERLAYLDWLRFIVVLALAPFHAALSYTGYGYVYVYDNPVRDAVLEGRGLFGHFGPDELRMFTVFLDNWGMHLLFLVSGMGAVRSLRKRSAGAFVGERATRLMLPYLVILLTLVPIQSWFRALDFKTFSAGFFAFYPHFFNGVTTGPAVLATSTGDISGFSSTSSSFPSSPFRCSGRGNGAESRSRAGQERPASHSPDGCSPLRCG